jgi:hypothetical protein
MVRMLVAYYRSLCKGANDPEIPIRLCQHAIPYWINQMYVAKLHANTNVYMLSESKSGFLFYYNGVKRRPFDG